MRTSATPGAPGVAPVLYFGYLLGPVPKFWHDAVLTLLLYSFRLIAMQLRALLLLLAACASPPPAEPEPVVYFPDPPDPPRIQFLRSISAGTDVQPPESSGLDRFLFGEKIDPPKPILKPGAIAVREGVFYIADSELAGIFAIDFAHETVGLLPLKTRARVVSPQGLSFDAAGKLYIADRGRRQVVVLKPDFSWHTEYGPWEDSSGPADVLVVGDRMYVADTGAGCVRVLQLPRGEQIQVLGKAEVQEEFMRGPSSVAVDENGYLYVSDTVYQRVYVWDRDGNFVRQLSSPGDAPGHLARPKGLAYTDKKLWVLDAYFDNCQIFDLSGRTLMFFGGPGGGAGPGNDPGSMSLPRRIWVGKTGLEFFADQLDEGFVAEELIVVTNSEGPRKISFYALGKSSKFQYPEIELPERPIPQEATAESERTGSQ